MDMGFTKLKILLPMVIITTNMANEHVPEVERRISTIKEWCQDTLATLSFSYLLQQLIINLVQFVIMWLNALPNNLGVSHNWSPCGIIC